MLIVVVVVVVVSPPPVTRTFVVRGCGVVVVVVVFGGVRAAVYRPWAYIAVRKLVDKPPESGLPLLPQTVADDFCPLEAQHLIIVPRFPVFLQQLPHVRRHLPRARNFLRRRVHKNLVDDVGTLLSQMVRFDEEKIRSVELNRGHRAVHAVNFVLLFPGRVKPGDVDDAGHVVAFQFHVDADPCRDGVPVVVVEFHDGADDDDVRLRGSFQQAIRGELLRFRFRRGTGVRESEEDGDDHENIEQLVSGQYDYVHANHIHPHYSVKPDQCGDTRVALGS